MAPFLSEVWIGELDRSASGNPALALSPADSPLVVEQRVIDGGPGGHEVAWHISIDGTGARVRAGRAEAPDVWFSQDRETAEAIARGRTSAQAAFMVGRLTVGGDVGVLLAHRAVLEGIDDVFADVRAATTYEP